MRMFKKVLAGFVAAAMVATMAGCGSSNSSTKDSGSDKAAAEATTEAAAPAKVLNTNAANKLIYCITPSTSNPYFGTVQTACKEEGEKLGYKVKCVSHDDDATKQSELFDTAISEGASAIVCDNAGADASIEAVQKAYDAGIPTFMVTVRSTKKVFAYLRSQLTMTRVLRQQQKHQQKLQAEKVTTQNYQDLSPIQTARFVLTLSTEFLTRQT